MTRLIWQLVNDGKPLCLWCSDDYMFELAGSAEVKGKSEPLKMFKVRGYKDSSGNMVEVKMVS